MAKTREPSVTFKLPTGRLKDRVEEVMTDEFDVACVKWGVSLDANLKNEIFDFSWRQLHRKVESLTNHPFRPESEYMKVDVKKVEPNEENSDDPNDYDCMIIRVNDGWRASDDESSDRFPVDELCTTIVDSVLMWSRTAVFYGVGSYA